MHVYDGQFMVVRRGIWYLEGHGDTEEHEKIEDWLIKRDRRRMRRKQRKR